MKRQNSRVLFKIALCAAFSVASLTMISTTGASAQDNEEVTVVGHYGPDNGRASLSQAVSYADLNLSSADGRREFKHRITLTARYLCDKLGENDSTTPGPVPSCRDAAERNAMAQAGPIIDAYRPGSQMAGPAWTAPYPSSWDKTYPDDPN